MIKIIYVCMYVLLKACNKHFYQVSRQIRFKIKAVSSNVSEKCDICSGLRCYYVPGAQLVGFNLRV